VVASTLEAAAAWLIVEVAAVSKCLEQGTGRPRPAQVTRDSRQWEYTYRKVSGIDL
jgi:hypothetical protein